MAVAAALVNQFATPGLGSLMARKWVAGAGQLLLAVAGFLMLIVWYLQWMASKLGDLTGMTVTPVHWLLSGGAMVFILSWLWSLVTSLQLMNEARRNEVLKPIPDDAAGRQN